MTKKKILTIVLILLADNAFSSFAYVPYEQLLAEAAYIVTGEIIDKKYQKKASVMNKYERNPLTGEAEIVQSSKYMAQFTDYELEIDEVIKGEIDAGSIKIDAIGGCDEEQGVCSSFSTGYSYEVGSRVLMFLKKRPDRDYFQSTQGGLTAYLMTDDGRIYKYKEELDFINGSNFSAAHKSDPKTLEEIKSLLNSEL